MKSSETAARGGRGDITREGEKGGKGGKERKLARRRLSLSLSLYLFHPLERYPP